MIKLRALSANNTFLFIVFAAVILIVCISTYGAFERATTGNFYFVGFDGRVHIEKHRLIPKPDLAYILNEYFSGPIYIKKFPVLIFKIENLDSFIVEKGTLKISLTEDGAESFNALPSAMKRTVGKILLMTVHNNVRSEKIDSVAFYLNRQILLSGK